MSPKKTSTGCRNRIVNPRHHSSGLANAAQVFGRARRQDPEPMIATFAGLATLVLMMMLAPASF